jgi:hypothetical protein
MFCSKYRRYYQRKRYGLRLENYYGDVDGCTVGAPMNRHPAGLVLLAALQAGTSSPIEVAPGAEVEPDGHPKVATSGSLERTGS